MENPLEHPVMKRYEEPHRVYHAVNHIKYMLGFIPDIRHKGLLNEIEIDALQHMILYHDAVYNIPDPDRMNEELSAQLFLEENPDHHYRMAIAEGIRITKHHQPSPLASNMVKILVDLDLIGLSNDEVRAYNDVLIQQEVGANDEQWAAGRAAWLSEFLKRRQIFFSPIGEPYEETTRKSLEKDLRKLQDARNGYVRREDLIT